MTRTRTPAQLRCYDTCMGTEPDMLRNRIQRLDTDLAGPRGQMPHLRPGIEHELSQARLQLAELDTQRPELSTDEGQLDTADVSPSTFEL